VLQTDVYFKPQFQNKNIIVLIKFIEGLKGTCTDKKSHLE